MQKKIGISLRILIFDKKMKIKQDYFEVLRKIKEDFKNQRQLAKELNFSLGKLNYCLIEIKKKD